MIRAGWLLRLAVILCVSLLSACTSFEPLDLATAIDVIQPGDRLSAEYHDGTRREFVVIAVVPPDLIEARRFTVRTSELVELKREYVSVPKTALAVVGGVAVTAVVVGGMVVLLGRVLTFAFI